MAVVLAVVGSILMSHCTAEISFRRAGWLDRVVEYQKGKFLDEFSKVVPIEIKIQDAPPGYKDSKDWDFDSVSRLLKLIYSTESAKPVQLMLDQALQTTSRRYQLSEKSLMKIPSLADSHPDFFYDYDHRLGQVHEPVEGPWKLAGDEDILYISNPVEAQMPSRHISVGLLKDILMKRALEARQLPTKATPKTPSHPEKKPVTAARPVTSSATKAKDEVLQPSSPSGDTDITTPANELKPADDETPSTGTQSPADENNITSGDNEAPADENETPANEDPA